MLLGAGEGMGIKRIIAAGQPYSAVTIPKQCPDINSADQWLSMQHPLLQS